jgi:hypothetical protein
MDMSGANTGMNTMINIPNLTKMFTKVFLAAIRLLKVTR